MHKTLIVFVFAALWRPSVQAAAGLPAHLAGSWGTAESLYAGSAGQTDMHLAADGFGFMAGSTSPARRADGKDDGMPAPRAVIGFPVQAEWDGTTLSARVQMPEGVSSEKAVRLVFTCRYHEAGPALDCTAPDGRPMLMKRLSAAVAADAKKGIGDFRQQMAEHKRKP